MADLAVIAVVISAAIAVGVTGIAAAWAEKNIGSAAIGAMAEKEELFGKGLVLTVIPETIVIFGLTVALVLLFVILPQLL
ncbi:MAG: V-type ATP synthase subunit K [Candidatus Methanofastidiosum sp.]|nr:V-type ATP synthase subunit K [Methanofastidiosum sp.]NYT14097.1 V-type ATP synthase subunit K [Candidatus Methanofastidiosa archaeon]